MRVLAACSLGGASHLRSLMPLLDETRRGGSETLIVGPANMAAAVNATGHPFRGGGHPGEEEVRPIREQLPVLPADEASVLGNRELFGRLAATALLPAMRQAVLSWRPDLIVRDPCEYASAVVAAQLGQPAATVAIGLAEAEWSSIDAAAPALEEHQPGLTEQLRGWPYLTRFPAALDPSPFPGTVRYRQTAAAPGAPLPDWWPGLPGPLVYVSFGTVLGHMSFAAEVYRAAIDAVTGLDARVLVTTGHGFDPARLGELPGNVHAEAWVEQADVLAEAELVVCHGGSGTTYGALAAGVPLVLVPVFADQFANGRVVTRAGAAVEVRASQQPADGARRPVGRQDAPQIRAAIETVLAGSARYRQAAQAIAAETAAAPSIETILGQLCKER